MRNTIIKVILVVLVIVSSGYGINIYVEAQEADQKTEWIDERKQSPEFLDKMNKELEREYYETIKIEADTKLEELKVTGFERPQLIVAKQQIVENDRKTKQVEVVRNYLKEKRSPLASNAEQIVEIPRFVEAIAITGKETSFCVAGVGRDHKKNCGAIKNQSGNFKTYSSRLDAVQDMGILLQKPLYKDRTIEQMNGIYCQDASRLGRECANWTETIMQNVDELNGRLKTI